MRIAMASVADLKELILYRLALFIQDGFGARLDSAVRLRRVSQDTMGLSHRIVLDPKD